MKEVPNPELRGAKSRREFARTFAKAKIGDVFALAPSETILKAYGFAGYGPISEKGTATFESKVGPEYIKGSKKYAPEALKEIKQFISKNPKRFAKGVGGALAGLVLTGHGISRMLKGEKK